MLKILSPKSIHALTTTTAMNPLVRHTTTQTNPSQTYQFRFFRTQYLAKSLPDHSPAIPRSFMASTLHKGLHCIFPPHFESGFYPIQLRLIDPDKKEMVPKSECHELVKLSILKVRLRMSCAG